MKTDVEELSPTRVKLTIEVPFDELKPNLDKAYKEISKQIRLKGFRPGKVPARLIDQYVGRGAVLQEAVNEALPEFYGRAVQESDVFVLGQPEVEITKLDDGRELSFTAEVDIRPKFEVPDYDGLPATVDDATVTPDEVEEALGGLRERFAVLKGEDRPAQEGDFVSIDLSATVGGEAVEEASTSGYSYEVGTSSSVEGLDDALAGMEAGESKTFTTTLAGGDHAGEEAEVTVTVHSVKVKELPELDDEFAQTASEFDTIGELRADIRKRLERNTRTRQLAQARDRALEALLEKVDIPLPDSVVEREIERRKEQFDQQLTYMNVTREQYFSSQESSEEKFDADMADAARHAVKGGFLLDQLAVQEDLKVENEELSEYVFSEAMRMGVQPQQLAQHLTDSGQLPALVAEVLRNKALNLLVEHAKITDESGGELDYAAVQREISGAADTADTADTADAADAADAADITDTAAEASEGAGEESPESSKSAEG